MFSNRITQLFQIEKPIIQAGMIWASGWRLASAVSNSGGLGIIGSGSMYPEVLKEHIQKCKAATAKPFAVNVPMLYPDIEKHIRTIVDEGVKIVFTSAGNPKLLTPILKSQGITVVHVVSSSKFAQKAEEAGCDALVAEGFEAGGHNGREETTTMVLIPAVKKAVSIPVIAAGGIATGRQMMAAMVLGAEGVQIGSRYVASEEASSHINFKNLVINSKEGDTKLMLKQLAPVRLIKNKFYEEVPKTEALAKKSYWNCWAVHVPKRECLKVNWSRANWRLVKLVLCWMIYYLQPLSQKISGRNFRKRLQILCNPESGYFSFNS